MSRLGIRWSRRNMTVAVAAAVLLVGAGLYALDLYRDHQRRLALERLLQETCDECAARHDSVRRLKESLKNGPQEAPATGTP